MILISICCSCKCYRKVAIITQQQKLLIVKIQKCIVGCQGAGHLCQADKGGPKVVPQTGKYTVEQSLSDGWLALLLLLLCTVLVQIAECS